MNQTENFPILFVIVWITELWELIKIGMEITVNGSDVVTDIHPCYKTDAPDVLISNPSAICVLFHIFLGSLSVVTVCGNLLVIISIIYFKQLHTPTNSLILSLAVADLLVGVVVFPLTMEFSISSCLYHDDLFCKVRGVFDVSLCTSSILNLCCISIDRYYAVCQPLIYTTKINHHVAVIMILMSWGVSVLIGTGFIIVGINQEKCAETCFTDVVMANILGLIFSFYLPVIVMLCIYLKIFLVAQRQARSIQSIKSGAAVSKMERKATKTLAIVMGIFLMCWFPFFLCTTIMSFSPVYVALAFTELLNWLALSNSMLNPFIYAFFYSWFRSAFRMIISGKIFQGDFTNSKLL
uniref:trace amine-associated receptor 1-like n=1 Tax=Scatophagus argus TaxID=75038 RepID=UPI001ED83333|nr:trace amine-associated receptor 1-like [Scatophagus argus]